MSIENTRLFEGQINSKQDTNYIHLIVITGDRSRFVMNGIVTCKSVAPFTSVAIIQVVDKSQLLINKGDTGLQLFNFDLNIQEEVLSAPKVGALLNFDN